MHTYVYTHLTEPSKYPEPWALTPTQLVHLPFLCVFGVSISLFPGSSQGPNPEKQSFFRHFKVLIGPALHVEIFLNSFIIWAKLGSHYHTGDLDQVPRTSLECLASLGGRGEEPFFGPRPHIDDHTGTSP